MAPALQQGRQDDLGAFVSKFRMFSFRRMSVSGARIYFCGQLP